MMLEVFFEFITILFLWGIIALACVVIIIAMCMVASDADDKEDEWIEEIEKGRLDE